MRRRVILNLASDVVQKRDREPHGSLESAQGSCPNELTDELRPSCRWPGTLSAVTSVDPAARTGRRRRTQFSRNSAPTALNSAGLISRACATVTE